MNSRISYDTLNPQHATLVLTGKITALDARELHSALHSATEMDLSHLTLNLVGVESLLSVHLGSIFQAKFRLEAQGKTCEVLVSRGEVASALERVGFKNFLYENEALLAS